MFTPTKFRPNKTNRLVLWCQWRHYYADDTTDIPQVVMKKHHVFDMNMAAWMAGITTGMQKHQVRPLAPNANIVGWSPNKERAEEWLNLCTPFTGSIEPIDEHIAALDLSDHPNPAEIAKLAVAALEKQPFGQLRHGCGPSKWLARLAMIHGSATNPGEDPAAFLAPLSVDKLPIAPEHSARLEFLGYRSIGDVAKLPFDVLYGQFGQTAYAISQAAKGLLRDDVKAIYPPHTLCEPFFFASPVDDIQVLMIAIDQLAEKLTKRMTGLQTSSITLVMELDDDQKLKRERDFKRPVFDLGGIRAGLRYLAALEPKPSVGITHLSVELAGIEPMRSQQQTLFLAKDKPKPDAFINMLQSAFGDQVVVKAAKIQPKRRDQVLKEWRDATGWR